ncbi:TIGR00374 family protein, partial [Rhodococcus opacus]|nr:TIGR00374 family protein [Rhodococcus opacus]NKY75995.1 TIGR00374 family protein [Rhodococcus opacus]
MTDAQDTRPTPRRRRVEWVIGGLLVVVLAVEIVLIWPDLSESVQ